MQAPVEIRYEGAILAKGVAPTGSLEEGLFLPLADPMPVGTRLELRNDRETHLVRVVRVTESAEAGHAGISVKPAGHPEPIEFVPEPEPVAPAVVHAPHPPAAPPPVPTTGNGVGKASSVSGTLGATIPATAAAPAPTAAASTEHSDGVPDGVIEPEDTGSTSEYPAISNGAGAKRRQKKKKPR